MKNLLTVWIAAGLMIMSGSLFASAPEAMVEEDDFGFEVVDSDYEEDTPTGTTDGTTDSEGRSIPTAPSPDSLESESLSRSSGDITPSPSPSSVSSTKRRLSPAERIASVFRLACIGSPRKSLLVPEIRLTAEETAALELDKAGLPIHEEEELSLEKGIWPLLCNPRLELGLTVRPEDTQIISAGSGSFSDKIFIVKQRIKPGGEFLPKYVFKVLKNKRTFRPVPGLKAPEVVKEAIEKGQHGFAGRLGIRGMFRPKSFPRDLRPFLGQLPRFCLVEKYIVYTDPKGIAHYIEVIHAAGGINGVDFISSRTLAREGMKALGIALATFHRSLMMTPLDADPREWRTIAHGDLHLGNVFWNPRTKRVFFIDNESVAENPPTGSPIDFDLFWPSFRALWTVNRGLFGGDDQLLGSLITFFNSYISVYPADIQPVLRHYIYAELLEDHLVAALAAVDKELMGKRVDYDPFAELTPWWLDKNKDQRQAFFLYQFLPTLREAADTRDFLARALEIFRAEGGGAKHISRAAK